MVVEGVLDERIGPNSRAVGLLILNPIPMSPIKIKSPVVSRSGGALLAAASAGLLSQGVSAATYNEPPDLSDDSGTPTSLPAGTDTVIGAENSPDDFTDHFSIGGLIPGNLMALSGSWTFHTGGGSLIVEILDSSNTTLANFTDFGTGGEAGSDSANIIVPSDGVLKFGVLLEGGSEAGFNYNLQIASVPEAKTQAAVAMASLAALLHLRRRKGM